MEKILILAGGYSNEREISLITAKSVIHELKKNKKKYKLLLIEPDGNFVKKLRKYKPNFKPFAWKVWRGWLYTINTRV